jgi:L-aminopeptidase/D-esterase-like protein
VVEFGTQKTCDCRVECGCNTRSQASRPRSFAIRATGITAYLKNGGKLEIVHQMAAHESFRTTGLYDPAVV